MKHNAIVILHGWGLSGYTFQPLVDELTRCGYQAYAPDLPGFGESKLPDRPLTLDDYSHFLEQYLKVKKIQQLIIIGHSFGGRVGIYFTPAHPNMVRALVLTGTPGYKSASRAKLVITKTLAVVGNALLSLPVIDSAKESVRNWFYRIIGVPDYTKAKGVMKETFKLIVDENLAKPMKALRVPCVLIWGEEDRMVPVEVARRMSQTIRNSQLVVIPAADHAIPYKHPNLFVVKMKQLLK